MKFTFSKWVIIGTTLFVALIYFATSTAFTFSYKPAQHSGYYGLLVDAYTHGQLSLRLQPHPKLLEMKAPYDPAKTREYRLNDATLHNGKFYFYWGPVPAIVRILLLDNMHESFYSYLYILGSTIYSLLILYVLRRMFFRTLQTRWLLTIFSFFSLNGVVIYMLACVGIYYEAIAAGQFFLLGGIFYYLRSLELVDDKKKHTWYLVYTSLMLGLCVGSRVSLAPGALVIFGYELYRLQIHKHFKRPSRELINKVLAITLPLFSFFGILALYNLVRFGSIFDFGLKEQLLGPLYPVFHPSVDIQNIPNNIKNYFFSIPSHTINPPYIITDKMRYTLNERVIASIGIISPLIVLIFLPFQIKQPVKSVYWLMIGVTAAVMAVLLYTMPFSPIRYFFDIIYLFNIVAAIKVMAWLLEYKDMWKAKAVKIFLGLALCFMLYYSWAFFLYAIMEYHIPTYFGYNQKVYKDHNGDRKYIDPMFNVPQITDDVLMNGTMH